MRHSILQYLFIVGIAWVEFGNIGINPGPDETVVMMVNNRCRLEVNAQDVLYDYQKIECIMLKKCFGEKDPIECKTP